MKNYLKNRVKMIVICQHLDQNYLQKDHLKKTQGNNLKSKANIKTM